MGLRRNGTPADLRALLRTGGAPSLLRRRHSGGAPSFLQRRHSGGAPSERHSGGPTCLTTNWQHSTIPAETPFWWRSIIPAKTPFWWRSIIPTKTPFRWRAVGTALRRTYVPYYELVALHHSYKDAIPMALHHSCKDAIPMARHHSCKDAIPMARHHSHKAAASQCDCNTNETVRTPVVTYTLRQADLFLETLKGASNGLSQSAGLERPAGLGQSAPLGSQGLCSGFDRRQDTREIPDPGTHRARCHG